MSGSGYSDVNKCARFSEYTYYTLEQEALLRAKEWGRKLATGKEILVVAAGGTWKPPAIKVDRA